MNALREYLANRAGMFSYANGKNKGNVFGNAEAYSNFATGGFVTKWFNASACDQARL